MRIVRSLERCSVEFDGSRFVFSFTPLLMGCGGGRSPYPASGQVQTNTSGRGSSDRLLGSRIGPVSVLIDRPAESE